MKCDVCGGLMTTTRNEVRRYDLGGLPHVSLQGIEITRCQSCGDEEITIPRITQLHRVLAEMFIKQQRNLAPVEVRFLRKHLGLSVADFASTMGVERETVSRWENGKQPMGTLADRLLRLLVVTHEPTENYAVDDLLRELTNTPAPEPLAPLAMQNSKDAGWRRSGRGLASV